MKAAVFGKIVLSSDFRILLFLMALLAALARLSIGLYPPFRGRGALWSDLLGATPDLVRFISATSLMILILRTYVQGGRSYVAKNHAAAQPIIACGLLLAGYTLAFRLGVLNPLDPWLVSFSLVLWAFLFMATVRFANAVIPPLEYSQYWIIAVLVGAAAALSPRLESATSALLAPILIEPTLRLVAMWLATVGHGDALIRRESHDYVAITVDGFEVGIAQSCSGYEGAGLAILLVGAYVWFNRDRLIFPRVLIVFPLIACGMFLMNSIRIFILILIGAHISPAIAVEGFHIYAGWIYLITSTVTACFWLETSRWLSRAPQLTFSWRQTIGAHRSDEALLIVPLIVFLALSIILGAFSSKLNWLYPITVVLTTVIAWPYARHLFQNLSGFEGQAITLGCAVAVLWFLLVPEDPTESAALASQLFAAPGWAIAIWIMFRMAGAVLVVPVVEELGFRGAIQGELIKALNGALGNRGAVAMSIVMSAILFGLLHSAIIAGTLAGLCYGWLRYHSGSLSAPILAHAVTNLIISMYVLITGAWSYW